MIKGNALDFFNIKNRQGINLFCCLICHAQSFVSVYLTKKAHGFINYGTLGSSPNIKGLFYLK